MVVFRIVLRVGSGALFWLYGIVRWGFEMRELVVIHEVGFVDEWLLVVEFMAGLVVRVRRGVLGGCDGGFGGVFV